MLCMGMSQQEIALDTQLHVDVVAMYEYYFFDVRSKSIGQILHYITSSTAPEKHDGLYKYFGVMWGYRMCKHFMHNMRDLNTQEDYNEFKRIISTQTMSTIVTAAVSYTASVEQQMSIALIGMREKLVTHKIETAPTGTGAGAGGVGDPDANFLDLSDDMALGMTKIEDQRALDIGGRAAANYIEDAKKTHMESAMEAVTADVDVMTPEDLKEIGFQQDSGDS